MPLRVQASRPWDRAAPARRRPQCGVRRLRLCAARWCPPPPVRQSGRHRFYRSFKVGELAKNPRGKLDPDLIESSSTAIPQRQRTQPGEQTRYRRLTPRLGESMAIRSEGLREEASHPSTLLWRILLSAHGPSVCGIRSLLHTGAPSHPRGTSKWPSLRLFKTRRKPLRTDDARLRLDWTGRSCDTRIATSSGRRASESIIVGLPVPQIFLYEQGRNNYLVIDGQQRLMSIYYYIKGRFPRKEKRVDLRLMLEGQSTIADRVLDDEAYFSDFRLTLSESVPASRIGFIAAATRLWKTITVAPYDQAHHCASGWPDW